MLGLFNGIYKALYMVFIDLFDGTLLVFLDGFFDVIGNLLGLANDLMLNLVKRPIAGISPSWTDKVLLGLAKGYFDANWLGLTDGLFLCLKRRKLFDDILLKPDKRLL